MIARPADALKLNRALDLLRRPDHRLVLMHTHRGPAYFVVPGGPVTDKDALAIIARPDVRALDDGLFPGCAQSWRLKNDQRFEGNR